MVKFAAIPTASFRLAQELERNEPFRWWISLIKLWDKTPLQWKWKHDNIPGDFSCFIQVHFKYKMPYQKEWPCCNRNLETDMSEVMKNYLWQKYYIDVRNIWGKRVISLAPGNLSDSLLRIKLALASLKQNTFT